MSFQIDKNSLIYVENNDKDVEKEYIIKPVNIPVLIWTKGVILTGEDNWKEKKISEKRMKFYKKHEFSDHTIYWDKFWNTHKPILKPYCVKNKPWFYTKKYFDELKKDGNNIVSIYKPPYYWNFDMMGPYPPPLDVDKDNKTRKHIKKNIKIKIDSFPLEKKMHTARNLYLPNRKIGYRPIGRYSGFKYPGGYYHKWRTPRLYRTFWPNYLYLTTMFTLASLPFFLPYNYNLRYKNRYLIDPDRPPEWWDYDYYGPYPPPLDADPNDMTYKRIVKKVKELNQNI